MYSLCHLSFLVDQFVLVIATMSFHDLRNVDAFLNVLTQKAHSLEKEQACLNLKITDSLSPSCPGRPLSSDVKNIWWENKARCSIPNPNICVMEVQILAFIYSNCLN